MWLLGLAVLAPVLIVLVPTVHSGWLIPAIALAAFVIVGYVNAFNFMDGINGISVAQTTVAAGVYAAISLHYGERQLAALELAVVGAALGFLPWNAPRARVFLGDTGSYALGAVLASFALLALASGIPVEATVAPLVLYLADTGTTLVRRLAGREPWYLPHRTHTYQQLTDLGLGHMQVSFLVGIVVAVCSGLGAVSLTGHTVARVCADVAIVMVVSVYLAAPLLLRRAGRWTFAS
jgi:UDP-N-acetylmuramyl pentapeptide phosphotransferase/UDP-N-acetylglucosamine-1-phosphate transferase